MNLFQDLRFAARLWRRRPGQALLVVLALGIGIGLTATMYAIVYGTFLRPLPFPDSQELVRIERSNLSAGIERLPVSIRDFLVWRERQASLETIAIWYPAAVNLSGPGGPPQRSNAAYASTNIFELLGVAPVLGRSFRVDDGDPAAPSVVLIGDEIWQERFGRNPAALGQTIRIYGEPATIIGVMPRGFRFPFNQNVWIPLKLDPVSVQLMERARLWSFARLKDGVTREQASADLGRIAAQLVRERPETNEGIGVVITPYVEGHSDAKLRTNQFLMLGAVFAVFLIACGNVASLLLIHSASRSHELALRAALGAGRRRIVSQLLSESCLLALAGGGLGWILTRIGVAFYRSTQEKGMGAFWENVSLDAHVFGILLGITLAAGLLSGILPALRATGARMGDNLRSAFRGVTGEGPGRLGRVLAVAQLALACGLLVATGLMIKSIVQLTTQDFGFRTDHLLTAELSLSGTEDVDSAAQARRLAEIERRIGAIPGVRSVALTSVLPGRRKMQPVPFALEDMANVPPENLPSVLWAPVTPSFFETLELRPLAGRIFRPSDDQEAPLVGIVNQAFTRRYFSDREPIGQRLHINEDWITIIGVVPDILTGDLGSEDSAIVYLPFAQNLMTTLSLLIRTEGPPLEVASRVREEIVAEAPDQPVFNILTMEDVLASSTRTYMLASAIFVAFGVAAFYLAVLGLYSTVAFSVGRREQEFGIRIALGASPSELVKLVLRKEMGPLLLGVLFGLGISFSFSRLMTSLLYKVEQWDPTVFVVAAAGLLCAGSLACFLPARRALRTDPVATLKQS